MVILKQGNNHETAPCPSESNHAVERAFLRLGNVLAEIAEDVIRRKANISRDTTRKKDGINRSQSKNTKS